MDLVVWNVLGVEFGVSVVFDMHLGVLNVLVMYFGVLEHFGFGY